MAKEKAGNGGSSNVVARPRRETMARVGSVANAPWFHLANGNKLYGILENLYERPDERSKTGKSKFFQVRLLDGCEVRLGRGKDAELTRAVAGQVVNLNYGPKTKELEKFLGEILKGAEYTVECIVAGEKFDIGRGQTMWPVEVFAECTRAPTLSEDPDFSDDGDDSIETAQAVS